MSDTSYKPTSLLPKVYPVEEHALDIANAVRVESVRLELQKIKTLANPAECPVEFLPILAYSFGSDFYWEFKDLAEAQQREMIANSLQLHRKKGTLWAIKKVLNILGFDTEITECWEEKEDPFGIKPTEPYSFVIVLDVAKFIKNSKRVFNEYEQRRVLKYLYIYKNVRSDFDFYVKASHENRVSFLSNIKVVEVEEKTAISNEYKNSSDMELGALGHINTKESVRVKGKTTEFGSDSLYALSVAPIFMVKGQAKVSIASKQYEKHNNVGFMMGTNMSCSEVHVFNGEFKRPIVSKLEATIVATLNIQEVNRWQ